MEQDLFLSAKNISKYFAGTIALNKVDIDLKKGEVHCLAGMNGCGKSTFIKVISGVYTPEKNARIDFEDNSYTRLTPGQAINEGVQVIFQDLSLFPNLTVAENIGVQQFSSTLFGLNRRRKQREVAQAVLDDLGFKMDLEKKVEDLSIANRQIIAICRAIANNGRLLIMDEPTASLTRQEVRSLERVVKTLTARGITIVFVSHRLEEVLDISDRVTVLRDGVKVGTYPASEMTTQRLGELMTGIKIEHKIKAHNYSEGDNIIEVKNLSRKDEYTDISFSIKKGEVLGLGGLLGSGRTELATTLFGIHKPDSGQILVKGKPVTFRTHSDAVNQRIGYVSEDRLSLGAIMEQSIADNISISVLNKISSRRLGVVQAKTEQEQIKRWIKELSIKIGFQSEPISTLSGGNQQKVMLAKWLATDPELLILDSPTVGVDVSAKASIYVLVDKLAASGVSILLISDEVPELYYNCDRVLHMKDGRLVGEYSPREIEEHKLMDIIND